MKRKHSILIILTAVLAGILLFVFVVNEADDPVFLEEEEVLHEDWETFMSEDYGFSIKHPADWSVIFDTERPISPMFSFYVSDEDMDDEGPFDHHHIGVTHVSVYPLGIPTEGVFGQTAPLPADWSDEFSEDSIIYILEDGTPFAAYLGFGEHPDSWGSHGFVWAKLKIEDKKVVYFVDGEEVDGERDPLGDPSVEVVRRGHVDEEMWLVLKSVAESINFSL